MNRSILNTEETHLKVQLQNSEEFEARTSQLHGEYRAQGQRSRPVPDLHQVLPRCTGMGLQSLRQTSRHPTRCENTAKHKGSHCDAQPAPDSITTVRTGSNMPWTDTHLIHMPKNTSGGSTAETKAASQEFLVNKYGLVGTQGRRAVLDELEQPQT